METKRFGFKMKMLPGFKEEYKKRHNEIWPELASLLKNEGIGNYSIFLDEETNILFAYQDISQSNTAKTQLYYVSFGTIGTSTTYTPLPLPDGLLSNPKDHPEPALRPAK